MRYLISFLMALFMFEGRILAAPMDFMGVEPRPEFIGAPLYPGAHFVRTIGNLDPFYETAIYVTTDKVADVKKFYSAKLPRGIRTVTFVEENVWVWTYLLKSWIDIPDDPSRDDITILEASPNIQVKQFQIDYYFYLLDYFRSRPGSRKTLEALESAQTIIRYTYEKPVPNISRQKIEGKWRNVDRDLPELYGSIFSFNPDGTYSLTLTEENIEVASGFPGIGGYLELTPADDIDRCMSRMNPERGKYSVLRNTITLETDRPLVGDKRKAGIAFVKQVTLSVQFVNMKKLSFIRVKDHREGPPNGPHVPPDRPPNQ